MLKIRVIRDVPSRVAYTKAGLSLNSREKEGRWLGSAVASAGFTTPGIPAEDLAAALSGYSAQGQYLGQRRSSRRRAGWDVVLSPHKSISLAALCLSPSIREAVRTAWDLSVATTVAAMESLAGTSNGKAGIIPTGNLLVAAFTHSLSSPGDPHLHTHCILINTTQTAAGWRSLEPAPLYRQNLILDGILQRELLRHLLAANFNALADPKGRATLPDIPQATISRFSRAKNALDEADANGAYGSLASIAHHDTRRNLLNDRIRPRKRPPLVPLRLILQPGERRNLSRQVRPQRPKIERPPALPSPQQLASDLITPIYRRRTLWPSPKHLFNALLEVSRAHLGVPFLLFLRAIPFVRPLPLKRVHKADFSTQKRAARQRFANLRPRATTRTNPKRQTALPKVFARLRSVWMSKRQAQAARPRVTSTFSLRKNAAHALRRFHTHSPKSAAATTQA